MKTFTTYSNPRFTNKYSCCIESWANNKVYSVTETERNKTLYLNEREYEQFINRLIDNGWRKNS